MMQRASAVKLEARGRMAKPARLFVAFIFFAIALFLVSNTWLPARDSLRSEPGKVSRILAQPNTWHEVEITAASGARVTCRARRGWPLAGPSRCPLEAFEPYLGQSVTVLHDGSRPYEVTADGRMLLSYSVHRQALLIAWAGAGLMLAMAIGVWRRKRALGDCSGRR
jgi:hypothetical protein